jgi:hypothetical protein
MHLKWVYIQPEFKVSEWKLLPSQDLAKALEASNPPEMVTVLSLDKAPGEDQEERHKIKYLGPLYFDWDCASIEDAIVWCGVTMQRLKDMGMRMTSIRLYATGGRGFHAEIPMEAFMLKVPTSGITYLPAIYREIAYEFATEGLDLKIYSMGKGRMWRTPNVKRDNGNYKVPITWDEFQELTPEKYAALCAAPRTVVWEAPEVCAELMSQFDTAQEKVKTRIAKLKVTKPELVRRLSGMALPSLDAMLEGRGLRTGLGFQEIAVQLAVIAISFGWDAATLVQKAQGLIAAHEGDSTRYGSAKKRESELKRMHAYMVDNPCYAFSVAAIRSMLSHTAQDLDGIEVDKESIEQEIKDAEDTAAVANEAGDYNDLMSAIRMSRRGIYITTDEGSLKRICAVSFDNVWIMRSLGSESEPGKDLSYLCDVYIGGTMEGVHAIDAENFLSLQSLNRYLGRFSQVCYGTDAHVKGILMAVGENARRNKRVRYVTNREGLDFVHIPMHPDPTLREPFMVWSDYTRVVVSKQHEFAQGINLEFLGYPDPRGMFQTDLSLAPNLAEWVASEENRQTLRYMVHDLMTCQAHGVMSKMVGWYIACFYKVLFMKKYKQFPLMHVYGEAGAGKTQTTTELMRLFFHNQPYREVTPQSTMFALMQYLGGSASIPLIVDEYKPHEMQPGMHNKFKAIFRDSYNAKQVVRGGGTRENSSFAQVSMQQLAAPVVFIAEAPEVETAVMERVVAVNFRKAAPEVMLPAKQKFDRWRSNSFILSMIGRYLVSEILDTMTVDLLEELFRPIYDSSMEANALPEDPSALTPEEVSRRAAMPERTIFNYSVARFGLYKLRSLLQDIYELQFDQYFGELFKRLDDGIFEGTSTLASLTMPEWAKVINAMAMMTQHSEPDPAWRLAVGRDYATVNIGGQDRVELNVRMCYAKYRTFCVRTGSTPLFINDQSFMQALTACPAFLSKGVGSQVQSPGTFSLSAESLSRTGVDDFKGTR